MVSFQPINTCGRSTSTLSWPKSPFGRSYSATIRNKNGVFFFGWWECPWYCIKTLKRSGQNPFIPIPQPNSFKEIFWGDSLTFHRNFWVANRREHVVNPWTSTKIWLCVSWMRKETSSKHIFPKCWWWKMVIFHPMIKIHRIHHLNKTSFKKITDRPSAGPFFPQCVFVKIFVTRCSAWRPSQGKEQRVLGFWRRSTKMGAKTWVSEIPSTQEGCWAVLPAVPVVTTYTTWKVDGTTPMYWFLMAPY